MSDQLKLTEPARMLELEEYLMANTLADNTPMVVSGASNLRDEIRSILHTHRFMLFSWLLMNGAQIPGNLVMDTVHPRPGEQSVDKPAHG